MWVLQLNNGNNERLFYLVPDKKQITVGRSSSDICIEKDSSISRKHCVLFIDEKSKCPFPLKTRTGIWVVDSGSKYGTFVQNSHSGFEQVPSNKPMLLQHGGAIRFGILDSVWSITYKPIYVSTTVLNTEEKLEIRGLLQPIGGDVLPNCDKRCSYLVTSSISLTAKVLLAMIYGMPIVKSEFIKQIVECIKENKKIIDDRPFRPQIIEASVQVNNVNLDTGFKRDTLFRGKTFYVNTTDVMDKFQLIVKEAGGSMELLKNQKQLLEEGAVFLYSSQATSSQSSEESSQSQVQEFLKKHGLRKVPDREVPLAIAYASTDIMCNPASNALSVTTLFGQSKSKPIIQYSQSTMLAEETQYQQPGTISSYEGRSSIPETQETQVSSIRGETMTSTEPTSSRKRLASNDIADLPATKRVTNTDKTTLGTVFSDVLNRNTVRESSNTYSTPKETPDLVSSKAKETERPTKFSDLISEFEQPESETPWQQARSSNVVAETQESSREPFRFSDLAAEFGPPILGRREKENQVQNDKETAGSVNGKRKNSSEDRPPESQKRSRLSQFIQKPSQHFDNDSNDGIFKRSETSRPASVASVADRRQSGASDARSDDAYNAVTTSDPRRTSLGSLETTGWIDMADLKSKSKCDEDLSTSIVTLSLVNTSLCKPKTSFNDTSLPAGVNVKVFRKQKIPDIQLGTIEMEIPDDFDDVAYRIAYTCR